MRRVRAGQLFGSTTFASMAPLAPVSKGRSTLGMPPPDDGRGSLLAHRSLLDEFGTGAPPLVAAAALASCFQSRIRTIARLLCLCAPAV